MGKLPCHYIPGYVWHLNAHHNGSLPMQQEKFSRFCFAKEDAVLDKACHRLESYGRKNQ